MQLKFFKTKQTSKKTNKQKAKKDPTLAEYIN